MIRRRKSQSRLSHSRRLRRRPKFQKLTDAQRTYFHSIWELHGDLYVSSADRDDFLRGDHPAELSEREVRALEPSTRGLAVAGEWGFQW
jgi:hypothetical protein